METLDLYFSVEESPLDIMDSLHKLSFLDKLDATENCVEAGRAALTPLSSSHHQTNIWHPLSIFRQFLQRRSLGQEAGQWPNQQKWGHMGIFLRQLTKTVSLSPIYAYQF